MQLSASDKLGPYEIIAPMDAGGMDEVYRAHDPRWGIFKRFRYAFIPIIHQMVTRSACRS